MEVGAREHVVLVPARPHVFVVEVATKLLLLPKPIQLLRPPLIRLLGSSLILLLLVWLLLV